MNLAIDPDVFVASFIDDYCRASLVEILSGIPCHRFIRDDSQVLEREYRIIFNEKFEDYEHPAVRILQYMLSEDGDFDCLLSAKCNAAFLEKLKCWVAVEPTLLGMLANARTIGLVLVLVGRSINPTRQRVLHDADTFRDVGRVFPWLDVLWAGIPRIELANSLYENTEITHLKSREFEGKVALWLQDLDSDLRCSTPPKKSQVENEQIDVWGTKGSFQQGGTLVIGECKLRRKGNEIKDITGGEVQQLCRILRAGRRYLIRQFNPSSPVQCEGILVSNALALDADAKALFDSETDLKLRFLNVQLQSGWETMQEWQIVTSKYLYESPANRETK